MTYKCLSQMQNIFDSSLGVYTHQKVHIGSIPGLETASSVSGALCQWTNIQKGTPTSGWYLNSWLIQWL